MHAPIGVLKPTAINGSISLPGSEERSPHSLSGSTLLAPFAAVHLLQKGTPLKTIGDILGHRTAESTSMYLRLATGDLREVALEIPA